MKAKMKRLSWLARENAKRLGAVVAVSVLSAGPALAQTAPAQPDVSDVTDYMIAGIATIALVGNARLIVRGAVAVFRWVGSMIR
jgi:hypothetical protein